MTAPERILATLRARMHRPLTDAEERMAERWASGETSVLLLRDYAFGWRDRERMSE
jgi:hypothetical protein